MRSGPILGRVIRAPGAAPSPGHSFPQLSPLSISWLLWGVPKDIPPRQPAVSGSAPGPMVPMSAEDFARKKRKVIFVWIGGILLGALIGVWLYQSSSNSQEFQKAFDDGEQMLKATRYPEAIQSLSRAVELNSNLASAYLLRGRAHAALDQTEPALKDFAKAIELQPANGEAYMERAAVHLAANQYAEVVADCGEALSRDPKRVYAHTLRGMAYRELRNFPKALEDFNRAVELSPGLDNYFQRATVYQALGDHTKAVGDLDQVISLFPTSPMGYLARARSREAMGDAAGARDDRETGRRLEERTPGQ